MNSVIDGLSAHTYDATGRLTAASYTGQANEAFSYDANGNRTGSVGVSTATYTVGPHNRILNDGTSTYTVILDRKI